MYRYGLVARAMEAATGQPGAAASMPEGAAVQGTVPCGAGPVARGPIAGPAAGGGAPYRAAQPGRGRAGIQRG